MSPPHTRLCPTTGPDHAAVPAQPRTNTILQRTTTRFLKRPSIWVAFSITRKTCFLTGRRNSSVHQTVDRTPGYTLTRRVRQGLLSECLFSVDNSFVLRKPHSISHVLHACRHPRKSPLMLPMAYISPSSVLKPPILTRTCVPGSMTISALLVN